MKRRFISLLMEVFCEGEDIADAAEYFEYLDENFEWYTRFCQYLPVENNKITYYVWRKQNR